MIDRLREIDKDSQPLLFQRAIEEILKDLTEEATSKDADQIQE